MVFTFGRFNPPTTGHLLLATKVKMEARKRGAEHKIYGSGTQDKKKNPLSPTDKFLFMKKVLKGFNVVVNRKYNTIFSILQDLSDKGYGEVVLVVGSDRVGEFRRIINKYVGPNKDLKFSKFEVISAGERDPDADGVSGMSASKMRAAASDGNMSAFRLGMPSHVSRGDALKMFDSLRKNMGVKSKITESWFDYDEFKEFNENGKVSSSEDDMILNELSVASRRKLARRMKRTAKKRARIRKRKEKHKKTKTQLVSKSKRAAMSKMRKKIIRDMKWENIPYLQREKIDAKIRKKKGVIARLSKRLLPNMQKAETERLKKVQARMTDTKPSKVKESVDILFDEMIIEAGEEQKQRLKDKENNRGVGTSDPKGRDAARKRAERETEKNTGMPNWKDLRLVRGTEGKTEGKVMLVHKNELNKRDYDVINAKPTRGSAGSAAQEDDWVWTVTAKKMIAKSKEETKTRNKGKEDITAGRGVKGEGESEETNTEQSPEQKQTAKAQADMATLNTKEKEMQISATEKEFKAQQDAEKQEAEFEAQAYNSEASAWEQPQMVLQPRNASALSDVWDDLETHITIHDKNEGKQFEYAITVASDLSRGMSIDDVIRKSEANGGKNLSFSKAMFAVAIMTLGQLPEEDRNNLYHWDELGIQIHGEPKTDNVILNEDGSIKYKISLKNDKSFQLSSQQGKATAAGFRASLETVLERNPKFKTKVINKLIERVENLPTKTVSSKNADRVRDNPKMAYMFTSGGKIKKEYDYDSFRDTTQKEVTKEVLEIIKDNPEFAQAMVHENMTGANKYDVMGVPEAAASHMLSPHGFEEIGEDPFHSPTVARYAEKVSVRFRGKTRKGIGSSVFSTDITQPSITSDSGKLTGHGTSIIKNRSDQGDEYALSSGRLLGFNEMFSIIKEAKQTKENEEDLLVDKSEVEQDMLANPYEFATRSLTDLYDYDIDINNPNIEDSKEFNTITVNGKEKKIPVKYGNHFLRQIAQNNETNNDIDESFRMLIEPDILDKYVQRLIDKGMSKDKAYAIATSSLQNQDEDYIMALPDYPIQTPQFDSNLFDKTLGREYGWEIGDPAKPLDLHQPPKKKKKKANEEGGAGEMGTKKLLRQYIKDTPNMTIDGIFTKNFG